MSAKRPQGAGEDGRRRVVVEGISPELDCGRYPIKRVVGDTVWVEVDAFVDGHDAVSCVLLHRREEEPGWHEAPMQPLVNDRWRGHFGVEREGQYRYTVVAWADRFKTWRRDLEKRVAARQDVGMDLRIGARLLARASELARESDASGGDAQELERTAGLLEDETLPLEERTRIALAPELGRRVSRHPDRSWQTRYLRELEVVVDRERAGFSAWYEFFPRSTGSAGRHGTFADAAEHLPYVAEMGFDVVYLPPVHPVGRVHRKGKNNAREASEGDVGSPWAIGAEEGGHKAVHPQLGTLEDFDRFHERARELGLEVALDIAFQAAPDHPYVRDHPEWFRARPDGTIQYAENPPKKYEDIYPFDFESDAWRELWQELKSVFEFWLARGVRIFRVDNPHTKPFPFWEWALGELRREHPGTIFLSEAFTRPKVMYRLAKLGFTQSYTYFAWRNTKHEIEAYLTELTRGQPREFFRPNFWPNTPDILTEHLQTGGRGAFIGRLVLAATLSSNYGIYGPAFELLEHRPREAGSEEYLDSEKYQIRDWDLQRGDSLRELIARVNRIRRQNPALRRNEDLRFHAVDNPMLIAFSKRDSGGAPEPAPSEPYPVPEGPRAEQRPPANSILVVVNLDPHHRHGGWLEVPLERFGLHAEEAYTVHDLLSGGRFVWQGARNFVELPAEAPAHIFRVERPTRTEADFEYFM